METLNTLQNSVKQELASHILDRINDGVIDNSNIDDWHFYCFNEDYYIIGYYQASEWLKRHNIDVFQAINICQQFEEEQFGEMTKKYHNSETTANMLAYILGYELIYSDHFRDVRQLKRAMQKIAG